MAIKSDTRDCNGVSVTSSQLPPLRSFALMAKLGKIIAPILAVEDVKAVANVSMGALAPAIVSMLSTLDGEDLPALSVQLFASTSAILVNDSGEKEAKGRVPLNTSKNIDLVFAGNLRGMLDAMRFAIEINFADFIEGVAAALSADGPATPEAESQ